MGKITVTQSWLPAQITIETAIGAQFILDRVTELSIEYNSDGSTTLVATSR